MAVNANFDALLTTTLANYRKTLTDNIFLARPLTQWLTAKGRIRMQNGGTKIVEPLIYGSNDTVKSFSGYDTIDLDPQDGISAAEFEWKQYAASIAISGIEEAKNNGEQAIINLLEAKIMQAEESMKDGYNAMFFSDGTANSGKDWNGLLNIVGTGNTVGGINGATGGNEFWNSYVDDLNGSISLAALNKGYNSVSNGNDHPDLVLTTQALFEKYELLLQPALRYTDNKTADAGFQNLLLKGAPVTYDAGCTAGSVYFLNSKYITLVGHSDKWFAQTPFVRPENMDATYALIISYGNLTVRNRSRLGVITDAT